MQAVKVCATRGDVGPLEPFESSAVMCDCVLGDDKSDSSIALLDLADLLNFSGSTTCS